MQECCNYYCKNTIDYGHNGQPLFDGRVCDDCNLLVIQKRIENINKKLPRDYPVEESLHF
tara:strand:+ start:45 stop:224 length:180 start_codon:yes stop_codon:yes gene_type:complete